MDSFDPEDHRQFLEYFKAHVDPNDQLPVKVPGYNLTEEEIIGEVVNWAQSYLLQMKCPEVLLAPIINEVLLETKKSYQKIPKQCGFDGYSYNPLKLSIIVIGHINTICDRLMDNAELNKILPDNSEVTNIPRHSVKAIKNTRRKMEDRHICIRDFHGMFGVKDSEPTSFYGVFDGHGGQDAAIYTSAHLCYNIAKSSKYPHNIEAAMREAFLKTDDAFIDKSDKHAMYSGTTAVVFIYRANEKKLFAGWVGDSQALLAAEGKVCQIVSPHTPSVESERIRIEKMGGVIMNWDGSYRVNGQLAISRAIGKLSYISD
uniref:Protein phosphatase 1E n=1 Tax=Culex pipiens TaxID=7175 RepID=A0A8D8FMP6_CULPI